MGGDRPGHEEYVTRFPDATGLSDTLRQCDTELVAERGPFQVETVVQKRDVVVRGLTGRLRDLKEQLFAWLEANR